MKRVTCGSRCAVLHPRRVGGVDPRRALVVAGLALLAAGCSPGLVGDPRRERPLIAELLVGADRVELLHARGTSLQPRAPDAPWRAGRSLRWRLSGAAGTDLGSGVLDDPRWVHVGPGPSGRAEGAARRAAVGLTTVHLPRAGTLAVDEQRAGAWRSLGELTVTDPATALAPRRPATLDGARDLLGDPVVISRGSALNPAVILFLAEGYQEQERERYHEDVARIVDGMSRIPGYREHWEELTILRQDVRSVDSGVTDLGAGVVKDTAFDIRFTPEWRCPWFDGATKDRVLAATAALTAALRPDAVIYLANDDRHGACASQQIVMTRRPGAERTLAHELQHRLTGINDEYGYRDHEDCTVHRWRGPNLTDDLKNIPWQDLLTTTELPTPDSASADTVGAFEGGGHCLHGVYRPQRACLMGVLSAELCVVCRRAFDGYFAQRRELALAGAAPAAR